MAAASKISSRDRSLKIVTLVICLAIILAAAFFILIIFNSAKPRANNEVHVSGTVNETLFGSIQFINENETEKTRYSHIAPIINHGYSIFLVGGLNYTVYVGEPFQTSYSYSFSVFIPANVTAFTANF